jgi:hypothetical protein
VVEYLYEKNYPGDLKSLIWTAVRNGNYEVVDYISQLYPELKSDIRSSLQNAVKYGNFCLFHSCAILDRGTWLPEFIYSLLKNGNSHIFAFKDIYRVMVTVCQHCHDNYARDESEGVFCKRCRKVVATVLGILVYTGRSQSAHQLLRQCRDLDVLSVSKTRRSAMMRNMYNFWESLEACFNVSEKNIEALCM